MTIRLVRDEPMALDEEQTPAESADRADEPRRGRRRRNPDEEPDGEVPAEPADLAETEDEKEPAGTESTIDLAALEALLFSTQHPLTAGRIAELLDLPTTRSLRSAIRELNRVYESSDRSFRIEQVAGGYQLLTLPRFGEQLAKLHQREADAKLTRAAMETLAIIAYKQPILRADIEAIRGVACGETIRSLMEKHLVKIVGRAEVPGRPILYGTTRRFLELFGLNALEDLPQPEGQLKPKTAEG